MTHSSFTASERRGILVLAIIALLFIGGGTAITLCGRDSANVREIPVVVEHPEYIDTTFSNTEEKAPSKKKVRKQKAAKVKKTYRRRNPVEETVSP